MTKTKTIYELLTDEARTLLTPMLRVGETDHDFMFAVGIDTCRAAGHEPQGRATCSIEVLPRRRALELYSHLMTPADIEMLTVRRPLSEVAVLVVAGEEVAVGLLPTAYPSSLAAA